MTIVTLTYRHTPPHYVLFIFSPTVSVGVYGAPGKIWTWETAWKLKQKAVIGLDYDQDQSQSLIEQEPIREELPFWFGQSGVAAIVRR